MAIAIVTDPATGWLVARATGPLLLADVIDFVRNARADVETRRRPLLFDARGATTKRRDDLPLHNRCLYFPPIQSELHS